jgi:alpha-tubulin suppressor-like RCC1 family protein
LGHASEKNANLPEKVEGISKVAQVMCGAQHTVARVRGTSAFGSDSVYAWGCGTDGQLGLGNQDNQHKPVLVEFFKVNLIFRKIPGSLLF